MSSADRLDAALNGASRFASFLARAIPKLMEWWNERQDKKLDEQLDALDVALGRSFDRARDALSAKYPGETASVLSMAAEGADRTEDTGEGIGQPSSGAEGGAQ